VPSPQAGFVHGTLGPRRCRRACRVGAGWTLVEFDEVMSMVVLLELIE
jgi:hypothetical protein